MLASSAPGGRAARRGIGVLLILVVSLALVLFIGGVAQLLFSGQVYRQTARGSGGLAAEYLARSAVGELFYDVQKAVVTPGHPVFRRLREALLTGEEGKAPHGLIDLSKEFEIDLLGAELAKSEHSKFYGAFRFEHLTVHAGIDRSRPMYDNLVLRLGATARLGLGGKSVARRVEETRRMGILLAAPKRPLDQLAFCVLDYPFLPHFRRAAAGVVEMAKLYKGLTNWLLSWKAQVESKPPGAEVSFEMALPANPGQPAKTVRVILTGEEYRFDGVWPALAGDERTIKVPLEHSVLAVSGTAPLDLRLADHEQLIGEEMERALRQLPELAQRLERAMETFVAHDGRPFTAADHAAWSAQIGAVGFELSQNLELLVRETAQVSQAMAPHLKVNPDLGPPLLDQQGRLGMPLYPIAYHVSSQAQFDALFAKRTRLNAHVAYQGLQPLAINLLTVQGRMVISSERAPIEIENLVVSSKTDDLVVLAGNDVTFKGGRIDAGVIVRGAAKFTGQTTFVGNLTLEHLDRKGDRGATQAPHGRVLYNPALFSGLLNPPKDAKLVKWSRYAVGFSTIPEDLEILWKE